MMTTTDTVPPDKAPEPRVITFYSYKGGVGRSMSVANIAWILAERYGKRVTVVDWDLEAPGLHRYFGLSDDRLDPGVIDYLGAYKAALTRREPPISAADIAVGRYLRKVASFPSGGELRLMSAGQHLDRPDYSQKVRSFDWTDFYDNWNGAQLIEAMRNEFRKEAEITLIDSRTGLTDIGGVCTVQLPDIVVFVFAFNGQNISGIARVAAELGKRSNPTLDQLKRWPRVLFLPSRKEMTEPEQQRKWEALAAEQLGSFCDHARIERLFGDVKTYFRKVAVPYVPRFSYGEEIAVETDVGLDIRDALEPTVAMLLDRDADSIADLLDRSRAYAERITRRLQAGLLAGAGISIILLAVLWVGSKFPGSLSFAHPGEAIGFFSGIAGAMAGTVSMLDRIVGKEPLRLRLSPVLRRIALVTTIGLVCGAATGLLFSGLGIVALSGFAVGFVAAPFAQGILEAATERSAR